ncbi:hypothetical protein [Paenibacillus sp. O199]|uniref:hypothetical protein n=1 Tax=Paenibacillus sp. O199 TaxID=1643925 RepID=UPI000ABF0F80|nr:hypothetical protein [Paenibacillus sp. O199]
MGHYDDVREEHEKSCFRRKDEDTQQQLDRLMNSIGTSDPLIRKVVEVLYKEFK